MTEAVVFNNTFSRYRKFWVFKQRVNLELKPLSSIRWWHFCATHNLARSPILTFCYDCINLKQPLFPCVHKTMHGVLPLRTLSWICSLQESWSRLKWQQTSKATWKHLPRLLYTVYVNLTLMEVFWGNTQIEYSALHISGPPYPLWIFQTSLIKWKEDNV